MKFLLLLCSRCFIYSQQDFLYVGIQKSGIYAAFRWSNLLPIGSQKASYSDAATTTNKKDTDIPVDSLSLDHVDA
jgi:hypothetical protein